METDKPTIETLIGTAKLVVVETEINGRWNDNYYTKDGYYVIHEGIRHLVYWVNNKWE